MVTKVDPADAEQPRCGNCPCWIREGRSPQGECTKDVPKAALVKGQMITTGAPTVNTMTGFPIMPFDAYGCWQHPERAALYMLLVAEAMRRQQAVMEAAEIDEERIAREAATQ